MVYQSYPPSLWQTPVPPSTVVSVAPSTKAVGAAAFILTVTGTGFTASSKVVFDGDTRPTTFVDPTTLTASIASPTGVARTVQVVVSSGGSAAFVITATAEEPTEEPTSDPQTPVEPPYEEP